MQVDAHEPREGFEVDEFDFDGVRVGEDGLDAAVLLAVAGETALGVEEWLDGLDEFLCCIFGRLGFGFGKDKGEFVVWWECVASRHAVLVFDFDSSVGSVHHAGVGDVKTHRGYVCVGQGASSFHRTAEDLSKSPILPVKVIGWEAVVFIMVRLGGVAD